MSVLEIVAAAAIGLGSLLMLATAFGVAVFPDFYTRLHAAGKGDTLGQALVLAGLLCLGGDLTLVVKLVLIVFFIFIFNPTATHALARAGWVSGIVPWVRGGQDPGAPREPGA